MADDNTENERREDARLASEVRVRLVAERVFEERWNDKWNAIGRPNMKTAEGMEEHGRVLAWVYARFERSKTTGKRVLQTFAYLSGAITTASAVFALFEQHATKIRKVLWALFGS